MSKNKSETNSKENKEKSEEKENKEEDLFNPLSLLSSDLLKEINCIDEKNSENSQLDDTQKGSEENDNDIENYQDVSNDSNFKIFKKESKKRFHKQSFVCPNINNMALNINSFHNNNSNFDINNYNNNNNCQNRRPRPGRCRSRPSSPGRICNGNGRCCRRRCSSGTCSRTGAVGSRECSLFCLLFFRGFRGLHTVRFFCGLCGFFRFRLFLCELFRSLHHDCALNALAEQLAARLVNAAYRPGGVVGVRGAAAGAV